MKTDANRTQRPTEGFTLVELLVVIGIIAVLAAMLMTSIPAVIKSGKVAAAKVQMNEIALALASYETAYARWPGSRAAVGTGNPDFTFGGTFPTPSGSATVGTVVTGSVLPNADVMAILMSITTYPGTSTPTVNVGGVLNSEKRVYLNPTLSGDKSSPGVGMDLVYRDPWGNPYVISMDVNADGVCEDAFYKSVTVSGGGINGLILRPGGGYAFHGSVMVWSAGPDRKLNPNSPANKDENKDNVLSWH